MNSRRTILCVLEAIWESETSASILFLSSSLVLGITQRKVINFIQIEIYSLKSPNYEPFVVASNFLWCHWNMLLTVWTVIVKHWLWYSFAVKDDNFKEHRNHPLNGQTFLLKAKNCFRQNSKQIFRWEIDIYSNEEKKIFRKYWHQARWYFLESGFPNVWGLRRS